MKCIHCGHRVKPGKFCMHCGAQAPESEPAARTPQQGSSSESSAAHTRGYAELAVLPERRVSPWLVIVPVLVLIFSFIITLALLTQNSVPGISSANTTVQGTVQNEENRTDWIEYHSARLGMDELLLILSDDNLYYLDGITPHLLSDSAWDMDMFSSNEQIADGTFFVVESLAPSSNSGTGLYDEPYVVGDLIMITPDGERTLIDHHVYEVVFSQYDQVCFYQVVEDNRQKLCVVKDGVSHDLTGWINGNIIYDEGSPDGGKAYFCLQDDSGTSACIAQNGDYEVIKSDLSHPYWLVNDDQNHIYLSEWDDDSYSFFAFADGKIVSVISGVSDYTFNYDSGALAAGRPDGTLELWTSADEMRVIATGFSDESGLAFARSRDGASNILLYSIDRTVYLADFTQSDDSARVVGAIDDWTYTFDSATGTIYIYGDPTGMYVYSYASKKVSHIPFHIDGADAFAVFGREKGFYYTDDLSDENYDFAVDTTDLYYYDGSRQIRLTKDGSWFVGNVLSVFDGQKLVWQTDGVLMMADADGKHQKVILDDPHFAVEACGNLYAFDNDGGVYIIGEEGESYLIFEGMDDFMTYKPEW